MAATTGKRLDERVGRANDKITKDCFSAYKRDAWLQKFKRFNTAIPSSAAVERLFAVGSDILRSKRSSTTKENFSKFVLLHENEVFKKSQFFPMNNALFLNVSEWSFILFWCLIILIAVNFYFLFLF